MPPDPALNGAHALSYLEAAPDAIIAVDRDGQIQMVNRQAQALFGHPRDKIVGQPIELLVPDAVRLAHRAHRTRYRAAPRVRQMGDTGARLSAQRADGTLVPVEVALSPVEVDGAHMVLAVVRDVSDRVHAEAEQEVIRQSLDAVDDAVFMFDSDTLLFTYANAGATRQTGYDRDELVGAMTPLHIKPEYDEASFRRLLAPLIAESLQSSTFTTIHRTKSGNDIPVEISLSYPQTESSLARPMVALVRDVTDRQAADKRLQDSEHAFRTAFDDAGVPMAIVDLTDKRSRRVIKANQALADMLGYPIEQMPGLSMAEITHPEDATPDEGGVVELVEHGRDYHTEKRYLRSDGTYVWGALHASLIYGPDGEPRSLAHIVDITRRITAEAERDRRERELAALAAIRKAALAEGQTDDVLALVAQSASAALNSSHCVVATPDDTGTLICRGAESVVAELLVGQPLPIGAASSEAMVTGTIKIVDRLDFRSEGVPGVPADSEISVGPTLIVPLSASASTEGVMIVARNVGADSFNEAEIDVAVALASEAALTLVLARARLDRRRMFLAEDRERIARDLHDLVIQQIFATGMSLQVGTTRADELPQRAANAVDELDTTIGVIREAIFELTRTDDSRRGELDRLVDRRRSVGRHRISLDIQGDLDAMSQACHDQLVPTLNELLSNAERHADANDVAVVVRVDDEALTLTVTDDGVGFGAFPNEQRTGLGLRNLTARASSLGGKMVYGSRPEGNGSLVTWSVPIAAPPDRS